MARMGPSGPAGGFLEPAGQPVLGTSALTGSVRKETTWVGAGAPYTLQAQEVGAARAIRGWDVLHDTREMGRLLRQRASHPCKPTL